MVAGVLQDLLPEDGGDWHVQNLVIGSQPVPRIMMQKARARCDRLYTLYGSTEIGCVTSGEVDTGGCVTSGEVDTGGCVTSGEVDTGGCVTSGEVDTGGCVTSGEVDTGGKFLDYQAGGPLPGAEIKVKKKALGVSH